MRIYLLRLRLLAACGAAAAGVCCGPPILPLTEGESGRVLFALTSDGRTVVGDDPDCQVALKPGEQPNVWVIPLGSSTLQDLSSGPINGGAQTPCLFPLMARRPGTSARQSTLASSRPVRAASESMRKPA